MATRNVLVCGAGLMGHGIAQVMAAAGYNVWIFEPELARAEAGTSAHRRQPRALSGEGAHHRRAT